jgi:hypothetical protein
MPIHDDLLHLPRFNLDPVECRTMTSLLLADGRFSLKGMRAREASYGPESVEELYRWGYGPHHDFMSIASIGRNEFPFLETVISRLSVGEPQVRIMRQQPGQVLPVHVDGYLSYDPSSEGPNKIVRYLIALSDWDCGHYFVAGASVWHRWQIGDVVTWASGVLHGSANCGRIDKITMSVTGLTCT